MITIYAPRQGKQYADLGLHLSRRTHCYHICLIFRCGVGPIPWSVWKSDATQLKTDMYAGVRIADHRQREPRKSRESVAKTLVESLCVLCVNHKE